MLDLVSFLSYACDFSFDNVTLIQIIGQRAHSNVSKLNITPYIAIRSYILPRNVNVLLCFLWNVSDWQTI